MKVITPSKITKEVSEELKSYPEIIRQLLFNRDFKDAKSAEEFLNPKKEFGDPMLFYGMDKAVDEILAAVDQKRKIFIHGDYDVDGVSATSILWDFLYRKLKADVMPYIPSRFDDGYGITKNTVDDIISKGADLIISVDCGVKDIQLLKDYKKSNPELKFIITDHHTMEQNEKGEEIVSEDAVAVIHPRHPKSKYDFKHLCGTAVSWKVVCALAQKIGYDIHANDDYLDLVALATICDVMPLVLENRSIVKFGLEKMKNSNSVGLKTLILDVGIDIQKLDAYHLGFVIGPRINAAGRLEHALDAVRLLTTGDPENAKKYSDKLNALNAKRQDLTIELMQKAEEQIESMGYNRKLYFAWGEEWPEGIVGLVAGKLSEKYHRPVLIASTDGKIAKGSARSISVFDVVNAISFSSNILERYGGHVQAAGFTLKHENLEQFRDNLQKMAEDLIKDEDITQTIEVDAEVKLNDVNLALTKWIEKFKPFGFGNKTPSFILKGVKLLNKKIVGSDGRHVKVLLESDGTKMGGIAFGLAEEFKNIEIGKEIDLHVNFDAHVWNGEESVECMIKAIVV